MRGRTNSLTHAEVEARALAMRLLARRDLPSEVLREKLHAKGFAPAVTAVLIDDLIGAGLVNDERYAENYVAYHAGRGQGPIRLAAELRRCGLTAELIENALASGPDWEALARKVRGTKFGPQPPASWAQRARQARFLQYRGFSADHIRAATGAGPETGFTDL